MGCEIVRWRTTPAERSPALRGELRWAGSGRGKRGGLRVIYYWWVAKDRISLLLVYPKNEQDDLTADQMKQLRNQLMP
jgi:mRNA-degrading endonuclease RelE of RelBE toxin-antitoxin system